MTAVRVNLLRWSLKLWVKDDKGDIVGLCKFTPMEFETADFNKTEDEIRSVNLLRWSLKHVSCIECKTLKPSVNLLRWSLKPVDIRTDEE